MSDLIERRKAIDEIGEWIKAFLENGHKESAADARLIQDGIIQLPSAQQERVWHPVEKPPAHHKDVIVRGVEAIGNVTVHKVMQWDVDTWRPTDYAPSIMWTEWSEI